MPACKTCGHPLNDKWECEYCASLPLPPLNPEALNWRDHWLVVYEQENGKTRICEGQPTEEKAIKACGILNDHEERNGRARIYWVIKRE